MDTLAQLFGDEGKVRVMRLFLFNPDEIFDMDDVADRADLHKNSVKKIIRILEDIGLITSQKFTKKIKKGRGKNKKTVKKKKKGWTLDESFAYLVPLQNLLINIEPISKKEIKRRIKKVGTVKLLITAGVFLQDWDSRLDILIVGDRISEKKLERTMKELEADIGKELTYSVFGTDEFTYRLNIYDKLIRDVLDYPHEVLIDKLDVT